LEGIDVRPGSCRSQARTGGKQFALGVGIVTDYSQFCGQVHPGDGHEHMLFIECAGQDLRRFGKVPRGFFMTGLGAQCPT